MQRQDSLEMLDFPCYHNIDSIHPKIHNNLKTDQLKVDSTIDRNSHFLIVFNCYTSLSLLWRFHVSPLMYLMDYIT